MIKFILLLTLIVTLRADKPDLLLLKTYHEDVNVTGWVMSEKLDGVRAYWDGKHLISRSGLTFAAPKSFTRDFPPFELDGELWSQRGDFDQIVSITNQLTPHKGWHALTFNIFEVPHAEGNLTQRLDKVARYINTHSATSLRIITQKPVTSPEDIKSFMKEIETLGGEGIVVRDPAAPFHTGRSPKALKVKSYEDAECRVTGYTAGSGKYEGLTGALLCEDEHGMQLRIGSGLSDALRMQPPSIGTIITYKYYGLTSKGLPRHPVFMRIHINNR